MTTDSISVPNGASPEPTGPMGDNPDGTVVARKWNARLWLRWGAMSAAALALAAILGAYVLPREPEVTRSIDIAAPRTAVFPLVADLRHLPDWLPLLAADPNVAVAFTGPLDGVGQTITWESRRPDVGSGVERITDITPDSSVEMSVARSARAPTDAWFTLTAKGPNQTTVLWGLRQDLGFSPVARYRGLGIDHLVGPDYERGLARLKALAEAPPK
jgi:hypothetical protein